MNDLELTVRCRYYGWKWPDAPLPKTAKMLGLVAVPGLLYCMSTSLCLRHCLYLCFRLRMKEPALT